MAEPHAYNVFSSRCLRGLGSNPGGTTNLSKEQTRVVYNLVPTQGKISCELVCSAHYARVGKWLKQGVS